MMSLKMSKIGQWHVKSEDLEEFIKNKEEKSSIGRLNN